jgi:hypothetical protein
MSETRKRYVTCPECDGYGAIVIGHGYYADGSENNEERPCPTCGGQGSIEAAVQPITLHDLDNVAGRDLTMDEALALDAEKLAALTESSKP